MGARHAAVRSLVLLGAAAVLGAGCISGRVLKGYPGYPFARFDARAPADSAFFSLLPAVEAEGFPLDYTIRRDTLEIVGTDSVRRPPACLEDLARMMLQVEHRFDEPQDIEWAAIDGRVVLLQARPITVVGPQSLLDDGFDAPVHSADDYTPNGIVEMLPGVVSPLLWTINGPMIEHGYRTTIADLGADAGSPGRPFVGRFRGRAALNLSALRDAATSIPGGSAADVEEQFLGRTTSEDTPTGGRASLGTLWRARRSRKRPGRSACRTCSRRLWGR